MDNRLIDIVLRMPSEYRYSKDIVTEALQQLNHEVASVEKQYNSTLTEYVYSNKYLNHLLTTQPQKLPADFLKFVGILESEVNSHTYIGTGSWPNYEGLIRCHNFVEDQLNKHEPGIRNCPYLDYDAALESYRRHLEGENRWKELFSLLSLIETKLFEEMYTE